MFGQMAWQDDYDTLTKAGWTVSYKEREAGFGDLSFQADARRDANGFSTIGSTLDEAMQRLRTMAES